MPHVRPFVYADDTLVWMEGNPVQVQAVVEELKAIMQEYGGYTGQWLKIPKCSALLQGDCCPLAIRSIVGIPVGPYVRYLGWHRGAMAPYGKDAPARRNFKKLRHKGWERCHCPTWRRWGPTLRLSGQARAAVGHWSVDDP